MIRKLAFVVYVVTFTLGLLELGLRLFLPQPLTYDAPEIYEPALDIGWRHRPNAKGTAQWQGPPVPICTDKEGDRISCLENRRRDCVARVLAIGDSFVEALSVPYEETVWHRIENDTGACVDVAGVGGYRPSQYLQVARERLHNEAPYQVVVVNLFVGNDFSADASRIPPARDVTRFRMRWLPKGLSIVDFRNWLYPVNQYFESRSHVWVAFRNVFRRKYLAERHDLALRPSELTDEIIEASLNPIRLISEESRKAGTALIIVLIPTNKQVLDRTGSDLLRVVPALRDDLDMDLPTKRIVPRLREIPGAQLIDLLPALRERATERLWGELDPHFSPEGHAVWFELIRDELRRALQGEGSSEP